MRRLATSILIAVCLWLLPVAGISGDYDEYLVQWLELLRMGNAKEKQVALRNLGILQYEEYRKDPKVLDPIFAALKDKDPIVREAAAAYWTGMTGPLGVSMFKADIPSHLVPLLQDEVPAVRAEAAKAANGIKIYASQQLVDALIKSLHDKDIWVRLNAAFALGEMGYRSWSETAPRKPERVYQKSGGSVRKKDLSGGISSPPDQTGGAVVHKMKLRGIVASSTGQASGATVQKEKPGGAVVPPTPDFSPSGRRRRMASTREIVPHPSDENYKIEAIRNLLARSPHLDLRGAIAPMIKLLGKNGDWRDVFVQQEVVYAFAKMHVQDDKAIAVLLRQYDQAYLKKPIIKTLGIVEALEAESALLKSLEDKEEETRNVALEALLQLPIKWEERKREKITQDCKDRLNNPYPEVRTYAVKVLGKWDRKAGEKFILQALLDKSDKVAQAAIEELGNMDEDKFLGEILPYFRHDSKTLRDASVKAFHQLAVRTTNERVYAARKGTGRIISKIDDNLPRKNEHFLHRTASGLLVSEMANGDTLGKMSALTIIDDYEDERIEPQLILLLDDKVPEVHNRSSFLLREYGTEQSVPGLVKALKTSDRKLKLNAIFALGVIGDERAKKPLMELREDNDEGVRTAALEALTKYCDPNYLNDNNPKLRAAALRCLGQRGNTDVYEIALTELVAGKSQQQMIAAMDVISKTKDPRAVEPLIIILNKGDIHVAGKAASLLGTIGDRRAVEPLIVKLIYLDKLGRDYIGNGMKYEIIKALTKIGDPRAVPVLIQMLKSDSAGVIDQSIRALQDFKDSRAVSGLISVSDTFRYLQSSVRALGEIGSPSALDHLERLLYIYASKGDKWGNIRSDIIRAVGKINDERQVALLIRYLDSPDFVPGDLFTIVDILIKQNHKSPKTIMSIVRVGGKTHRSFCDLISGKIIYFAQDRKNPGDIAAVLIAALNGDNKDAKVGGIRIYGYHHRYNIIRDQRALDSLKQLSSDSDPRIRSEAETELKFIEMSQPKKGSSRARRN